MTYEIIIKGHLPCTMKNYFEPMHIVLTEGGNTRLAGLVPDQAALFGLLWRIRDLNIELVGLKRLDLRKKI